MRATTAVLTAAAASETVPAAASDAPALRRVRSRFRARRCEAAMSCLPLIQLGLMKLEQCVIALQYCSRMRVDFDTALDELGWTKPRKARKDLQL